VRRIIVRYLVRRLGRPVLRVLAVFAVAGVGIAVVKLLEGALLSSNGLLLRMAYVVLAVLVLVLAWPIVDAARPVRRDRP
jgi:4-amino-4-deoxy-L-arabinose transferase-like glycosyltransferase